MSNDTKAITTLVVVAFIILAMVIWGSAGADIRPSVVSGLFTLAAASAAAFVAFRQLRKQAEQTIAANRHSEAMKLKKEVYADILPALKQAAKTIGEVSGYLRTFVSEMNTAFHFEKLKHPARIPNGRFLKFNALMGEMSDAVTALMSFTEEWEIIEPRCDLFRVALAAALHDVGQSRTDYQRDLMLAMPIENAEGKAYPWTALNLGVERISATTEAFTDLIATVGSYVHDIH
jgi:hypothetical protein